MNTLINFTSEFQQLWESTKNLFESKDGLYDQIKDYLLNPINFHSNLEELEHLQHHNSSWGIYLFQIKPLVSYTFESLTQEWYTLPRTIDYSNFPKVCKGRFEEHGIIEIGKPYPFYIGKSEKLGKRIKEHLTHKSNHATYGLKLSGREIKEHLVYSYWQLPKELDAVQPEIKQFLLQRIESRLRDALHVWIGKQ